MTDSRSDVSVIVTTKDEEKNIGNCLVSIVRQTYPRHKMELIVIDNDSRDEPKEIAQHYADRVVNGGPEGAAQRNLGVKIAQGKYILYLDADMILEDKVIEECVNKCENNDYVALHIPERVIGNGFWMKVRAFERAFYDATCIDAVRLNSTA